MLWTAYLYKAQDKLKDQKKTEIIHIFVICIAFSLPEYL